MEFLKCKACGSIGMVPMDVRLLDEDETGPIEGAQAHDRQHDADENEEEDEEGDGDEQSRFYSCHVCGDNWLSIRRRGDYGQSKVTFIHQMGVEPVLRRIAHLQAELVLN
ncbi:MAG: hypothetical protein ACC655_10615, partial [Rhodothermia bacterium]